MQFRSTWFGALLACLALLGCATEGQPRGPRAEGDKIADAAVTVEGDGGMGGDGAMMMDPGPEFTSDETTTAFDPVWTIIMARCGCHRRGAGDLEMHNESQSYGNLLVPASDDEECGGESRVIPGDPEGSVLYRKVAEVDMCGKRMPPRTALESGDVEIIRQWIEDGAPR